MTKLNPADYEIDSLDPDIKEKMKRLASDSIFVQDACNLSGVVYSFSRAMGTICAVSVLQKRGTDWKNRHPVAILFSSKIASLTSGDITDIDAFHFAYEWAKNVSDE